MSAPKTHIEAKGDFVRPGHVFWRGYTLCGRPLGSVKLGTDEDSNEVTCKSCNDIWGKGHPEVRELPYFDRTGNTFTFAPGRFGRLGGIHPEAACGVEPCTIHKPSEHSMRSWPLNWRSDRMIFERMCPHGVGHPDPDSLYYERLAAKGDEQYVGVHGCDGCCSGGFPLSEAVPPACPATPEESPQVRPRLSLGYVLEHADDPGWLLQDLSDLWGRVSSAVGGVLRGTGY